jgi:hypothetical protein
MSDDDSISLGDNPFDTWASNDDLQGFEDAPSNIDVLHSSALRFEPIADAKDMNHLICANIVDDFGRSDLGEFHLNN